MGWIEKRRGWSLACYRRSHSAIGLRGCEALKRPAAGGAHVARRQLDCRKIGSSKQKNIEVVIDGKK